MPLRHLQDLVIAFLCLNNLCIHEDTFDMGRPKKVEEIMQNEANNILENLKVIDIFHVVENTCKNLQNLDINSKFEKNINEENHMNGEEIEGEKHKVEKLKKLG